MAHSITLSINILILIFNGGTGNDFHWLLYANKTLEEHIEVALNGSPKPIDIGKCNGRYFINGVGIGFEGAVAKDLIGKKKHSGKTSFLITVLKNIFSYRSKNYWIQSSNELFQGKKLLVDISNGARAGGGFHIAPQAKADDGCLDVVVVGSINPLQRLRYLPVIEKGKHLKMPIVYHFLTRKISIASDQIIQYHMDGEYFEGQKLVIEVLPAKVNFRY
jgi:YegS/Rv2252/BmrU family lipid kinase